MADRWTKTKTGVKTGISMPEKVAEWASELMQERGFDNFSAFVADLIRREKDRLEERKRGPGVFPHRPPESLALNEGARRKKKGGVGEGD